MSLHRNTQREERIDTDVLVPDQDDDVHFRVEYLTESLYEVEGDIGNEDGPRYRVILNGPAQTPRGDHATLRGTRRYDLHPGGFVRPLGEIPEELAEYVWGMGRLRDARIGDAA